MKPPSPISVRSFSAFFWTLLAVAAVDCIINITLFDEMRLALWADLLLALITAFISYCSSLREYLSRLEERIEALERQSGHSR